MNKIKLSTCAYSWLNIFFNIIPGGIYISGGMYTWGMHTPQVENTCITKTQQVELLLKMWGLVGHKKFYDFCEDVYGLFYVYLKFAANL